MCDMLQIINTVHDLYGRFLYTFILLIQHIYIAAHLKVSDWVMYNKQSNKIPYP